VFLIANVQGLCTLIGGQGVRDSVEESISSLSTIEEAPKPSPQKQQPEQPEEGGEDEAEILKTYNPMDQMDFGEDGNRKQDACSR
jgi:hypothetical protein